MKILHILPSFGFGGVESHRLIMAKNPLFARHENLFCAIAGGGNTETALKELGAEVFLLNRKLSIPSVDTLLSLYRVIREVSPDVVHCSIGEANFYGILAAWLAKVPVRIAEEVGLPSHSSLAKSVYRLVYTRAHGVIAVSGAVKSFLLEHRYCGSDKIATISHPYDDQRFSLRQYRESAGSFVIVTACRLVREKNIALLIDSFAALAPTRPEAVLWIVGDGPEREKLEGRVAALKLQDRVIFWGFRKDVISFFEKAHLYVLSSSSEGLPLTLVEAMATGLPVIATEVGGVGEVVKNGAGHGWTVPPENRERLSAAIEEVIALPHEERKSVGIRAHRHVQAHHCSDAYCRAVLNLYHDLHRRSTGRGAPEPE